MHRSILSLPDPAATEAAGRAIASTVVPGMVITLSGDLGAGKTTLVRGVLRGFDIAGPVRSPTYTLVEPYKLSRLYLYHFDFYRLKDPEEWEAAGFREYFRADTICLIEWPEHAGGSLPPADLELRLSVEDAGRRCTAFARAERAEPCIAALDRLASGLTSSASPASGDDVSSAG